MVALILSQLKRIEHKLAHAGFRQMSRHLASHRREAYETKVNAVGSILHSDLITHGVLAEISHTLRVASDSFGVFLLPFLSKFVELVEGHTDFLHPPGQAISHGRRNRRLVIAKDKPLLLEIP